MRCQDSFLAEGQEVTERFKLEYTMTVGEENVLHYTAACNPEATISSAKLVFWEFYAAQVAMQCPVDSNALQCWQAGLLVFLQRCGRPLAGPQPVRSLLSSLHMCRSNLACGCIAETIRSTGWCRAARCRRCFWPRLEA